MAIDVARYELMRQLLHHGSSTLLNSTLLGERAGSVNVLKCTHARDDGKDAVTTLQRCMHVSDLSPGEGVAATRAASSVASASSPQAAIIDRRPVQQ